MIEGRKETIRGSAMAVSRSTPHQWWYNTAFQILPFVFR